MNRGRFAGFGFMLSLIALYGCGPPAPSPQAVATTPAPVVIPVPPPPPPPPLVALVPGPVPVAVMPPSLPPPVMAPPLTQMASGVHPVIHHRRWVRRYAAAYAYGPACGTPDHPCNVSRMVLPIQ